MITWMQRHRKYLVITIWISTIAFVGAGFVGWGQYSYGDKADSVAKVGSVRISAEEFQKAYSSLFNQYNQLFQGKFDEKQAKEFGLQRQALQQLVNQAFVLNLAGEYGLVVNDEELASAIQSQPVFFKEGSFDKSVYEQTLSNSRLTKREYEEALRKELLIQKTLYLLAPRGRDLEAATINSALGINDKISYKLLTPAMITVSSDETGLKAFWEKNRLQFKTEPSYEVSYLRHSPRSLDHSDDEIAEYYEANRQSFKDGSGKLLTLDAARGAIVSALDDKGGEKEALRLYIDYKKGEVPEGIAPEKTLISPSNSPFSPELTREIMALDPKKPYLKPRKEGNDYLIVKLEKAVPARAKTYEEAQTETNALYLAELKKTKLLELAQNSYPYFVGTQSDFIGRADNTKLSGLSPQEGSEFLTKLFRSKEKQGYIPLENGNVIIYNVLEQKLLEPATMADADAVTKLKGNLLESGLINALEKKYPVEIYVEGI